MVGIIGATAASGRLDGQEFTNVGLVQRLMRAAYPELQAQQLKIRVNVDVEYDSDWRRFGFVSVSVTRSGERIEPTLEGQSKQPLVGFFFLQPQEGYIESAVFSGRHVNTQIMRDIEDAMEAHPEWSDSDVRHALTRAGAQYGPDKRAEFVRDLKIDRFEAAFGKIVKWKEQFEWQPSKDPVARDAIPPAWVVSLEAMDTLQRRICYNLTFEPIDGRLVGFRARGCQ